MARLFRTLAAALVAAGSGYAFRDSDAGSWVAAQTASLVEAAARGAAAPQPAEVAIGSPLRVLTARPGEGIPAEKVRVIRTAAPETDGAVLLPVGKSSSLPRPVASRIAQAGDADQQSAGSRGEAGRHRLTMSIQTELRRVGCYHGRIDGDWDADTRKAMKAFNDRVNASLPVTQPDYILLTLVQGHAAQACGAACPLGQAQAENGACQPRSVLAEARRKSTSPASSPQGKATADTRPWTAVTAGVAAVAGDNDRAKQASPPAASVEPQTQVQRSATKDAMAPPGNRAQVRTDEARTKGERELIAAAEERRRQRADELRAKAEAERTARVAEVERARIAAEARRRDELAALAAREADKARKAHEAATAKAVVPTAPSPAPTDASSQRKAITLADLPPATDRVASHVLAKPAEARFVGRYFPPPTYRVGRLPPAPRPRAQPPVVRVQGTSTASSRARLQVIFKSVERSSP